MVETGELLAGSGYPTSAEERLALCQRAFDRAFRPGGVMRQTHAIIATGSVEQFSRQVVAPTQVIHGSADRLLRLASGKRIAKLIRGARLEVIEGLGHDLPRGVLPRFADSIAANAGRA